MEIIFRMVDLFSRVNMSVLFLDKFQVLRKIGKNLNGNENLLAYFLFTTKTQKTQRGSFQKVSLCSLCLCGEKYISSL